GTLLVVGLLLVSWAPSCGAPGPGTGLAGWDSVAANFGRGRGSGGPACAAGSCGARAGRPAANPPAPGASNSGPSMPPSGTMASRPGGPPDAGGRRGGTAERGSLSGITLTAGPQRGADDTRTS